jgi:hypothetical protein
MKRIILLLLICLTVLAQSCSSGNVLSEGDTHSEVDSFSDPHSSPESVVRAFVEAVIAGDCDQAESYARPVMLWLPREMCVSQYYVSANIDDVIVKEDTLYNRQMVTLLGDFELRYGVEADRLTIYAEQIEGKWYACP